MGACCKCSTKIFVFIINGTACLLGLATILVGVWAYENHGSVNTELDVDLPNLPIALMVVGSVLFLLSFCACCGACVENKIMLGFYLFILGILMAGQIALGVCAFIYRDNIPSTLETAWDNADQQTRYNIEEEFNCCGYSSPSDYPATPCDSTWTSGCQQSLEDTLRNNSLAIGITCLTLLAIEFFAFVCPLCLCWCGHSNVNI